MTLHEKEELIANVLHDAKTRGGNIEFQISRYNICDPYLQEEIRMRWKRYVDNEKVKQAQEREAARAACGYAGNPEDQAIIEEANKEVASLIDEGTKEILAGR